MIVAHADEFWISKRGLNGTGTVGTAGTPSVWNCNPDDLISELVPGLRLLLSVGLWFGTHQVIVLLVVHMAFNPRLDTNMAKLTICVKDYKVQQSVSLVLAPKIPPKGQVKNNEAIQKYCMQGIYSVVMAYSHW